VPVIGSGVHAPTVTTKTTTHLRQDAQHGRAGPYGRGTGKADIGFPSSPPPFRTPRFSFRSGFAACLRHERQLTIEQNETQAQ
jgi:hypothetical protein